MRKKFNDSIWNSQKKPSAIHRIKYIQNYLRVFNIFGTMNPSMLVRRSGLNSQITTRLFVLQTKDTDEMLKVQNTKDKDSIVFFVNVK